MMMFQINIEDIKTFCIFGSVELEAFKIKEEKTISKLIVCFSFILICLFNYSRIFGR